MEAFRARSFIGSTFGWTRNAGAFRPVYGGTVMKPIWTHPGSVQPRNQADRRADMKMCGKSLIPMQAMYKFGCPETGENLTLSCMVVMAQVPTPSCGSYTRMVGRVANSLEEYNVQ